MELSIKGARTEAGYTQNAVAVALGINKNTYISYEKYRTMPDIGVAKRMATLFGRTVDEIKWTK